MAVKLNVVICSARSGPVGPAVQVLAVLMLAACQQPTPAPSQAPAEVAGPVNPDARVTTYACADGQTVEAGYPDRETAVVTYRGHAYILKAARSADGVRYVGMGLQWWTKGLDRGTLARLNPDEEVAADPGVVCAAR